MKWNSTFHSLIYLMDKRTVRGKQSLMALALALGDRSLKYNSGMTRFALGVGFLRKFDLQGIFQAVASAARSLWLGMDTHIVQGAL